MKNKTIKVSLEINFSYDEERTNLADAILFAKDLVVRPSSSIVNGVSVNYVEFNDNEL